jgi:phosphoglycolate phosphatase
MRCTTDPRSSPGVVLVTGPGGRGMTCSPGHRGGDIPDDPYHGGLPGHGRHDGGATTARVMEAFTAAITEQNLPAAQVQQAMTDVKSTMGQSKIEVFRRILGDEARRAEGQRGVRGPLRGAVRRGAISAMPGAEDTITPAATPASGSAWPPASPPSTRDAIIDELGWGELIDLALSPADAGRGRPWPDLPLTALLRLRGEAVGELAVAGDTASDVESGLRAGAGIVAGVLTGAAPARTWSRPARRSSSTRSPASCPWLGCALSDVHPLLSGEAERHKRGVRP